MGGSLTALDGKLWGITQNGGKSNQGVIFSIKNDKTNFIKIYDFNNPDGSIPRGGFIENDGKLWGVTSQGGNDGKGVVF